MRKHPIFLLLLLSLIDVLETLSQEAIVKLCLDVCLYRFFFLLGFSVLI